MVLKPARVGADEKWCPANIHVTGKAGLGGDLAAALSAGIASHPDLLPCPSPLDGSRALGSRSRSGCSLQLGLLRFCGGTQAFGKIGVLGPVHLTPNTLKGSG
jgi:hypothetical protein